MVLRRRAGTESGIRCERFQSQGGISLRPGYLAAGQARLPAVGLMLHHPTVPGRAGYDGESLAVIEFR